MSRLRHEVMHASLIGPFNEALLLVGTQAANVWAFIMVFRVQTTLLHVLYDVLGRLQPVQNRHAVVHEN